MPWHMLGHFFCSLFMTTITMSCGPDVNDVTSVYASAWPFQTLVPPCNTAVCSFTLVQYYYNTHAHDAP